MATKGIDKIIDGQIAFDFLKEIEVVKVEKPKKVKIERQPKENKPKEKKVIKLKAAKGKPPKQSKFRKTQLNIKHNHFKTTRNIRRIPRRFKRR